ncbi:MAG: Fe-S cluster assembly protein SufD [Candidatus Marinimicrobia bacterium]|nr:Fe-S cluster assembly protein SufD [Candidatus Neomarinimicrobiota bacterium]
MDKVIAKSSIIENWKYTNSSQFKTFKNIFSFKTVEKRIIPKSNEIIIYNGQLINCGDYIFRNNIKIYNINEAICQEINQIQDKIDQFSSFKNDKYVEENLKNYNTGYYIYFPKNLTLKDKIIIKNIIEQGNETEYINLRILIDCDENSKITILNEEKFLNKKCINIVNQCLINKNSSLEIINKSNKPDTKQIYNFFSIINYNSKLKYHTIDINSNLIKNNYFINLNGQGSTCLFNGLNISKNREHFDNYIEINHNHSKTISNLNYKIIADHKSRSTFFAKSIINEECSESQAYQKNNNLILSDKAKINANPQLEIYNDDVQCSHGSATGQIDEEAIFYLRSRGIKLDLAKQLILNSIINEVIEEIQNIEVQKNLKETLDTYMSS